MIIVINDISFNISFSNRYQALDALQGFTEVLASLRDDKVTKVSDTCIVAGGSLSKMNLLAPQYTLLDAVKDLLKSQKELALFLLAKLTTQGNAASTGGRYLSVQGIKSSFCAQHTSDFFISIISHPVFKDRIVPGVLNSGELCNLKNISTIQHIYDYWKDLGFREYELNPKHGHREYVRAKGLTVGIAPENNEKGQALLNRAIEIDRHLYSVDMENKARIFEFRWSYANKFHGFSRDDIPIDLQNRIRKYFSGINTFLPVCVE